MAEFPRLNSGGRVQYPIRRSHGSIHTDVNFWGGGGQTYRRKKATPLVWTIEYVGLSEDEAARLIGFCESHVSDNSYFSFHDPITGVTHAECAVIPDSIAAASRGVNAYEFRATIVEVEG